MHRIRYAIRRLPRPLDWIAEIILAAIIFCAIVLLCTASLGGSLFLIPGNSRLAEAFFQEPFLIFIFSMIAWFVTAARSRPAHLDELRYLRSLPLDSARICRIIIAHDLHTYAWVTGIMAVLLLYLNRVSPWVHQVRLFATASSFFVSVIMLNIVVQLARALRKNRPKKYIWPVHTNPFILILLIFLFGLSFCAIVTWPSVVSGYRFWVIFCSAAAACYILMLIVERLFARWQQMNLIFLADPTGRKREPQRTDIFEVLNAFPKVGPMVQKAIVRHVRQKNILAIVITLGFVTVFYLLAMNNEVKDGLAVLLGISCLFALTDATRCIQLLAPEEEAPAWIFSLPVKKADLYLSIFLPGTARVGFVILSMTALSAIFSQATIILLITFLFKALLVTMIILSVACSYAVYHYPVVETAKRQFLKWVLLTVILVALLYKYLYVVLILMTIWPFIQLRRLKLYRTG